MKRGKGPKRRKRLGADPEKVREFLRRGRAQPLERSELARQGSGPVNPPRPVEAAEGPLTPAVWRYEVWLLDEGRCVGCDVEVPLLADRWTWQAHHPLPKQRLPPERRWDPRNGVVLCKRCHEGHHGIYPIPGDKLPPRVRAFASELGTWAEDVVNRQHPSTRRNAL